MNILYLRNHASKVNVNTYNLQEIGFSKALVDLGNNCDVVYYNDKNNVEIEDIYNNENNKLRIIWMNGIKILDNGIYLKILNKRFLEKYDIIITTEYIQIMTFLLTFLCNDRLVLYHGPYKDQNRKLVQKLYDVLFLKRIKSIKNIFCKSELAKEYLFEYKKMNQVKVIGVGLDNLKIDNSSFDGEERKIILDIKRKIENNKVLLYIGVLEERRNILFLLDIFKYVLLRNENTKFIIIGNGKDADKKKYFDYAKEIGVYNNLIYYEKMSQGSLKEIYSIADVFLLPSRYEIFGMVLLESMYLGVPVISSYNGGSCTLIKNRVNGIIIDVFEVNKWGDTVLELFNNEELCETISKNSELTIKNEYLWDKIAKKILKYLNIRS